MHVDSINDYKTHYDYQIPASQYEMAENIYFEPFNLYVYLIQDRYTGKYNLYVLDDDMAQWTPGLWFIVKHYKVIKIEMAQFFFPQYVFSEETYGF